VNKGFTGGIETCKEMEQTHENAPFSGFLLALIGTKVGENSLWVEARLQ